jgi:hypothetical protein
MAGDEIMEPRASESIELDGQEALRFVTVLRVLYGALFAALAIYVVIAYVVVGQAIRERPWERPAPHELLFWGLVGVAIATASVIPLIRRRLLPRGARPAEGITHVPKLAAVRAMARYTSASIVSWALCEAIGVYGLILTFVTYDPRYEVAFAVVGAANMLVYAPRRAQVMGVLYAVAKSEAATAGDPRSP